MHERNDALRHVLGIAVVAPLLVAIAVLLFAWPAARLQPRDLPVGVIGSAAMPLDSALDAGSAFDVHHYPDEDAARGAIENRDVYGAFEPVGSSVTVLVASAASPTVAEQIETVAAQFAARSGASVKTVDVVPTAADDPHGVALASAVLPLVFGGEIIAVVVALVLGVESAHRQLAALVGTSAAAATAAYAIAQGWLGVLPHEHLAVWGSLGLILLAISATTAGLFAVLGVRGIGFAAATMILLGNPFSGVTSAPDLLPAPASWLGRLLPPGAAGTLLRNTAYFDGHATAGPLAVLLAWIVAGSATVVISRRRQRRGAHEQAEPGRRLVLDPAG